MSNPINLLERVQRIDLEIEVIRKDEEAGRRGVEEGGAELKRMEDEMALISKEIEDLKVARSELEEKIRLNTEKIADDEKRLGEVTKEKQINALTKEINNARKATKLHEIELTAINEKIENNSEELKNRETLLIEKTEEAERVKVELEEKQKGWEEAIKEKQKERNDVTASLNPALLKKYETIRERRGGLGVVEVKDETCRGCHMNIPPQTYIQLMRGTEEIITCPHCHRMLFFASTEKTSKEPSGKEAI